jgi:peptidoglycan/xylan/chitin deacetylase (PgdA/CDA1 family)
MRRLPLLFRIPNKLRRRARRNRIMALLLLLLLLLLPLAMCLYVVYRPPALLVRFMMGRFPDVLWRVDTGDRKVVALTIDDAPSQHTPDILRVLRENGAHATFFVIGSQAQGQAREDVLRDVVLGGNELGNHAWRDEGSAALGDEQLRDEMAAVKAIIRQTYAAEGAPPPPNYFRPGGGFFSARMRALADRLGYRIVLGDVYPHDPQMPWPALNSWHIMSMVRPGSIVICHDRRAWTVPMLETVLPELRRRGYEVVTVTQLLAEAGRAAKQETGGGAKQETGVGS